MSLYSSLHYNDYKYTYNINPTLDSSNYKTKYDSSFDDYKYNSYLSSSLSDNKFKSNINSTLNYSSYKPKADSILDDYKYKSSLNSTLGYNSYKSEFDTSNDDYKYKSNYISTLGYNTYKPKVDPILDDYKYKSNINSTLGYNTYKPKDDSILDDYKYKSSLNSTLGYNSYKSEFDTSNDDYKYKSNYISTLGYNTYKPKVDPILDDYKSKYNINSTFNYSTYKPKIKSSFDPDFKHKFSQSSYNNKSKYDSSLRRNVSKYDFSDNDFKLKYDSHQKHKSRNYSPPPHKQIYNSKTKSKHPLSREDKSRQKIAEDNKKIVNSNQFHIDKINVETIRDYDHTRIQSFIGQPTHKHTPIFIENTTTIGAAIENQHISNDICILNFANAIKPGGGYLNGRGAQEETLCRQTLLYPTLVGNDMYDENKRHGNETTGSDIMIYSPNVYVIRDDSYDKIKPFKVNVISSPAVDNRDGILSNSQKLMEKRIRKIVLLAASKRNDILILGAFGCGVFKNNPKQIAQIFKKVLKDEGLKDYFSSVIFPIKDSRLASVFRTVLNS